MSRRTRKPRYTFKPHQNTRECLRRINQIFRGQITDAQLIQGATTREQMVGALQRVIADVRAAQSAGGASSPSPSAPLSASTPPPAEPTTAPTPSA